jgi:hypothetical protein
MLSSRKAVGGLLSLALLLSAPGRAAQPNKYVPADAELVLQVNVQQLLDSKLAKKYALPPLQQALKNNKDVQQLLTVLGLDPLKDLRTLTISNVGQSGDKFQVALTGTFSLDKVYATAKKVAEDQKDKFKISKVGTKPLYEAVQQGKTVYAGFADDETMIVSPSRDYVVNALTGKTGKISKALQEAITAVDGTQGLWVALQVTEGLKTMLGRRQDVAAVFKNWKTGSMGINVSDAVAISLKVQTTDAPSARELGKQANEAKEILQFVGQTNEELKPYIDEIVKTLEIKTQQADVSVKFQLSQDLIEKAIKKIPGQ